MPCHKVKGSHSPFSSLARCQPLENKIKHLLKFNNWTYRGGTCIIFPVNFCRMPSISSCVILSAKNEPKKVSLKQSQKYMCYFHSTDNSENLKKIFFQQSTYYIIHFTGQILPFWDE